VKIQHASVSCERNTRLNIDLMTEGAIIQGCSPAMRRNSQSANLASALSTIVGINSQIQTDCNNNGDSDENVAGFIDDLGRRLQSTSSEIVARQLIARQLIARDTDDLAGLRDGVLQLVRCKWSCFPKGELQRIITRTRGTSASEKLAQDIVLLVKFYAGERRRKSSPKGHISKGEEYGL
jgi:hypothetical protein